jgi:aryl-alcohol dehydrogenase-like predicted oxidoreductase
LAPVGAAKEDSGLRKTMLGNFEVSAQGLGCMGMSEWYGPTDWDTSIETIHSAIDSGVTFLDTADVYGAGHNEVLVGRAVVGRRQEVQLATKFGIDRSLGNGQRVYRGEPAYVKQACESSLLRLGVDSIDLYYLHRPPQTVEIEETIGAMAELVVEGKVSHIGLSEVTGDLLRRANAVHPITAVQCEYSIWTRNHEKDVLVVMRELKVGLVAYSPLGRGFLTGNFKKNVMGDKDVRRRNPRFADDAITANTPIVDAIRSVAKAKDVSPSRVALAWIYAQSDRLGVDIVPIPGTKQLKWLEENIAALDVDLTSDDLAILDTLAEKTTGSRY